MDKFQLNTIYQGDCFEMIKDVVEFFGKENCIIISDPPFNINCKYNTYKDKIENYYKKMASIFSLCPCAIVHYPEELYKIAFEMQKTPERVCSWVYNSNTPRQHRDIAFFGVKPEMGQVIQPYKNLNDKRIRERISRGILGGKLYDWWEVNQIKNVSKNKLYGGGIKHPCIMPIKVMENIVGVLPKDKIIIDCFCGVGTTLIACKNLKRNYIGIEIDKSYYDIAIQNLKEQK